VKQVFLSDSDDAEVRARLKRARFWVPVLSFIATFAIVILTAVLVLPAILRGVESAYLELQLDINERQANTLARFVNQRLEAGVGDKQVLEEVQSLIEDTADDRGFTCVIDREDLAFLCHPMKEAIGMPVAMKEGTLHANFASETGSAWENANQAEQPIGGVIRYEGGMPPEIVYIDRIAGKPWTVNVHENTARVTQELTAYRERVLLGAGLIGVVLAGGASLASRAVGRRYESQVEHRSEELQEQRDLNDHLLRNILPDAIATRMKHGERSFSDLFPEATVMFCDLVQFTSWSARKDPEELIAFLNEVFSQFDQLTEQAGLEKIKTIGDAYMVVGGVPNPRGDHVEAVARLALALRQHAAASTIFHENGLTIRIGVHTGPVVAGVIGRNKFSYDLWGDTVNVASRMESTGEPGEIQCTEQVVERLQTNFEFTSRGTIPIKGKGELPTWLLVSEKSQQLTPR